MNTRTGSSSASRRQDVSPTPEVLPGSDPRRQAEAGAASEHAADAASRGIAGRDGSSRQAAGSQAAGSQSESSLADGLVEREAQRAVVERILARLRHEVGSEPCRRYLDRMAQVRVEGETLSITVPSRFMAGVIDRRLGEPLRRITAEVLGSKKATVGFVVDEAAFEQSRPPERPIRERSGLPGGLANGLSGSSAGGSVGGRGSASPMRARSTPQRATRTPIAPQIDRTMDDSGRQDWAAAIDAAATAHEVRRIEADANELQPGAASLVDHESADAGSMELKPQVGRQTRSTERLRFEAFVVGRANRMAYGGAVAVAEGDRRLSPLFIHGDCGMGKTHLLHALAARFKERHPNGRVRCVTAEAFTNQFIASTKANALDSFRAEYRSVDLLCVDDVSFVANKRATQSELLHTFDAINLEEKLVALASDEHPRHIQHLENGLVSRFMSGAVVRLDAPDPELRRELAVSLAERRGLRLEPAAIEAIEQRCQQIEHERSGLGAFGAAARGGPSVRDLEGLITQIEATVRLLPELAPSATIGAMAVSRALSLSSSDGPSSRVRRPVRIHAVMDRVCTALGVTADEFVGRGRHQKVVLARALCVLLARQLTNHSYPEIARAMGRPNHSTVITAHKRILGQIEAGDTMMLGPDAVSIDLGELAGRLRRDLERGDG